MIIYGENSRKSKYYAKQTVPTKTCIRCGETKQDTEFRRETRNTFSRVPVCRKCEERGRYVNTKVCSTCHLEKPLSDFTAGRNDCKTCRSITGQCNAARKAGGK